MKRTRNPQLTRQKIIKVTHRILRDGGHYTNFSLDKVAQEAGISKGGLMHHFTSKEALLYAVAQDTVDRFEADYEAQLAQEIVDKPGRKIRAYINTVLADSESTSPNSNPILLSFLRATDDNPTTDTRFTYWQKIIEDDDLDIVTASIIRLAVDGLLYTEIIDNSLIDPSLRQQIRERLLALAE